MEKVGILTGGGDAPGLNTCIRAVVFEGERLGLSIVGIRDGWKGLIEGESFPLTKDNVFDIFSEGGTILGTSRTNPYKKKENVEKVLENFKNMSLSSLIAMGGEDTLSVACRLHEEYALPIVGVPKTIDNDLNCTDYTMGFDTAVSIASDAIERLHTTSRSHRRVMVVEVMGRHAGWITLMSGIAGGAHIILIPEEEVDMEDVCKKVKEIHEKRGYCILAVAEGVRIKGSKEVLQDTELDEFGHVRLGGVGKAFENMIEKSTGLETRSVILGHLQRGGAPTAFDRVLATLLGIKAAQMVKEARFGYMATYLDGQIKEVLIKDAVSTLKTVPLSLYENIKKALQ